MRILLIHQYFLEVNDGGGSRFNELTKAWAGMGHQITVLAGMMHPNASKKRPEYKGKLFFKKVHPGNINVIRCYVSESYNQNFLGRLWGYFSFVFSSAWAGLFKVKGKYDIMLVTSPPLFVGLSGYFISRAKRLPFIFEVRDLWPESAIDTGVVKNKIIIKLSYALEKFFYKKAKLINVLTPAFRQTLIEKKGVPPEKIIFIPNAADFSLTDDLLKNFDATIFRKSLGIENKFVIIYVGAHGLANGLEQVLQTAVLLKDTPVLFLLIGSGMQKEQLIKQADSMNLKNVIFKDPVPKQEVFKYILAADIGASVLKKADTFKTVYSNKTFDYMACKKPILMAIDGVSRQLVEEAAAGIFVAPENPEDFAEKIFIYLNNPALCKTQGENGYCYAKKYFNRAYLAEEYVRRVGTVNSKDEM